MLHRRFVPLLLAVVFGGACKKDAPRRVLVTVEASAAGTRPEHLLFDWTRGEAFLKKDIRVPESGNLAATGPVLGSVAIEVEGGGARGVVVRGYAGAVEVGAVAKLVEVPADGPFEVRVTLEPGALRDSDGDLLPDAVDPCVTGTLAGGTCGPVGGADAGTDAALGATDAMAGVDAANRPDAATVDAPTGAEAGQTPLDTAPVPIDTRPLPDVGPPMAAGCPRGDKLMIDDFDSRLNPQKGFFNWNCGIGSWFTYSDGTPTASLQPPRGAEFTSTTPGRGGAGFAARILASGFTNSGTMYGYVGLGLNINNPVQNLVLPYDASGYSGVRFFAQGAAQTVRFSVVTADTAEVALGGSCVPQMVAGSTLSCNDHWGVPITIGAGWQMYELRWSAGQTTAGFAQEGWGVRGSFSPARVIGFQWQVSGGSPATPAALDMWVDDLQFLP